LWRITGNYLSAPSYLYGTIHLQDKRLFQFTDSLYHSLENVEGFALEVDFNEFMDSLFSKSFREAEDHYLETQEVKLDKKKIDKSADSILKVLGIQKNKMTKKDLKKIRDYRMSKLVQQGELQTIVDGYLYGLALRMGKWMGGIEDVADQLGLINEMGGGLSQEEVFQPEAVLRQSLNEMIKLYMNRDLQSLADYVDGKFSTKQRDQILIQRNVKMARRMDSLSALRTMFFAVGAAHLPGDSGVISLLRSKGFTVEPVFSPQSLSPEDYASKLNTIPWRKVDDDKLYSVEMPGSPSDYNMFGDAAKMKVFFDLPTMTIYMTGHSIAGNNNSVDLDEVLKSMAERMGGRNTRIQTKEVLSGNIKGKEASFDITEGSYKVRLLQKNNILYMLLVGSSKKSSLSKPDINKFFSSFAAKDFAAEDKKWASFTIPGKAFSIRLPGVPAANKNIDEAAYGSNWDFTTYSLADEEKGFFYLVQVRDLKPGYYLEGDTTYFSLFKESLSDKFDKFLDEEVFEYQGWPAFKLLVSESNGLLYKFFTVLRGNRVYNIIGGGGTTKSDFSDVDEVFNSLKLEEYDQVQWKKYASPGFSTTAPAPIQKIERDSTSVLDKNAEHFVAHNGSDALSYEVFKQPFSSYYWIKDDSSFFEERIKQYAGYSDSIIQKSFSYCGSLKSCDLVLQKPGSNTRERVKFFVNGDTLYLLMAFLPKQQVDSKNEKKFFDDFRVTNEVQPTIYIKKAKELLQALASRDTAVFSDALEVFQKVNFDKEDLPLLHQALVQNYIKREDDYYTVNDRIADVLEDLADESTIEFVANNYNNLGAEKEPLKYNLLEVLSRLKTKESYQFLKKLMLSGLPTKGEAGNLNFGLRDSLELTAQLYPDILSLAKDSLLSGVLVRVTADLLDSNLISIKDVLPYEKDFIAGGRRRLQLIKEDEENWWSYINWVPFIARFNDKESNDLLQSFAALNQIDCRYSAVLALIKNNQPVNAAAIEKVAEDKTYRKEFYEELKKINKLKLFPSKYATQLKIAESEIYNIASDDDEPSGVTFLGERIAVFMGKKQKFYLFKVVFEGEDYSYSYLGITGPYELSSKEIVTVSEVSGVSWDEEFDKKTIESQFKKYLSDFEEYLKNKDSSAGLVK
jgi:uncharacterized protein YbaP (TraB family)